VGIIITLVDFNQKDQAIEYRSDLVALYQNHKTFKIQYLCEITHAYYLKKYGNEKEIAKAK
jgi:hypothetical protein